MAFPADFMTYRQDLRPFGHGTVVSFFPDIYGTSPQIAATLTDLAEGELVGWNPTAGGTNTGALQRWLRDAGTPTNTQIFVGVSRDSQNTLASLGNQSPIAASFQVDGLGVWTTGIHLLLTKVGDVFKHNDPVFADINYVAGSGVQRTVTVTATSRVQIGTVYAPRGDVFTGAAGVRVPVLIDGFTKSTS